MRSRMTKEGRNERGEFFMTEGEKPVKRMRMGRLMRDEEKKELCMKRRMREGVVL
jgi:hypothetical protein